MQSSNVYNFIDCATKDSIDKVVLDTER